VLPQLARVEAIEAVTIILASVALLPLLVPRLLPPLAVVTLLPLLSKESAQGSLDLHYLLVPATVALLIAAVAVRNRPWDQWRLKIAWWPVDRLARRGHTFVPAALLGAAAVLWLLLSPLPPSFAAEWGRFDVDHHATIARGFVREIPPNVVVSAQSPFVAHLSDRRKIYQFPRVLDAKIVLLDKHGPIPVDDIVAGYADCLAALPRLGFDEVRRDDGISLWQKTRPAESVPEAPVACSGRHPDAEDAGE